MHRLYKIRLRLAEIQNSLETIAIMRQMAREEFLTPGKSKYQAPFRNFLFAFAVRLNRISDEINFHVEALRANSASSSQFAGDLASGWLVFIHKEKRIFRQAQVLLEGHHTTEALRKFDEAADGLNEICREIDALFVATGDRGLLSVTRKRKRSCG